MTLTRRQLIAAAGGAAAAHTLMPAVGRVGTAFGATAASPSARTRNRLIVIHLHGGNDGLNTIVPIAGRNRDVYLKVRPTLAVTAARTLPLTMFGDGEHKVGLNDRLATLHRLYRQGRVAIVQGVDYPNHSYSHFTSNDIWHSGEPGRAADSGWLGRHLDRVGVGTGEMRGVGVGKKLPLMLRGREQSGTQIESIAAARFADGTGAVADARHDALALFAHHPRVEPLREWAGQGARQAVDLVDALAKVPAAKKTGNKLGDRLLTARTLLGLDLGVECVYLEIGGYDTHNAQKAPHERLLSELDVALESFFFGTAKGKSLGTGALPSSLASRTIVMLVSEFGRRIGENGSGAGAGTDHGAAAPVVLIGPAGAGSTGRRLQPGLHGEHPPMGTTAAPADNLAMTTDMRRVYQSVLKDWLADPDPVYGKTGGLPGLFR